MSQADLFQSLLRGEQLPPEMQELYPFYPLNSPGMPEPGPNFVANAKAMGDPDPVIEGKTKRERRLVSCGPALEYLYRRALYDENFALQVLTKKGWKSAKLIPGHLLGDCTAGMQGGPRPARVLILGKSPTREDAAECRNFNSPAAQILFDVFDELGVHEDRFNFYTYNVLPWFVEDDQGGATPAAYFRDAEILLHQTLRLVRPDYVLCLGADALKTLMGEAIGVQAMTGRVEQKIVPVYGPGESPQYHTMQVMAAVHPAAVASAPERYPDLRDQVALFISLTNGAEIGRRETDITHRNVYKHRELKAIVDEILADPDPGRRIIAVDGEWEGEYPTEPGAYLRTVQFSSRHGEGITVVLRHQGGTPAFVPSIAHAIKELNRLLKKDEAAGYYPRPGGHFLRADLPWLIHAGIDIREEYAPAPSPDRCRTEGGWDTSLMYHAYNETASYRLTDVMVRLTRAPVYDYILKQHITDYCKANGIKKDDLEGFGFLPPWILHPEPTDPEFEKGSYACLDADVARRIAIRHMEEGGLLDQDWFGNPSWEPYWRSHQASLGVLEMEMTGIAIDRDRVEQLTTLFMEAQQALLDDFRRAINWPTFNPSSPAQRVALLFGDEYVNKRDKLTGALIPIRPEGAMCLGLTPVKTTGKRSKVWADVVARGEERYHSPSTDKEVLGALGHRHPLAMQLRDVGFISQVLKSVLRPPVATEDGMGWERDDDGNLQYDRGLASCIQADGRIRTHISQVKETGRASSARPPLQNLSSRRETDYAQILGTWKTDENGIRTVKGRYAHIFGTARYRCPVRTIFRAGPGCVLVEADYTGAELAMLAWLSGDPQMIEHVRRNILPEDHPDHYDIHSHSAARAFRLTCEPSKKGLEAAGLKSLRIAAKAVNFGVMYGRGADAIARQCREEGVDVTEDECQQLIDNFFTSYSVAQMFLQECQRRSQEERWLAGAFGRFRRFLRSRERSVVGEQQRQAMNFPEQNGVADAMWQAIANFQQWRQAHPEHADVFRLSLTIHDALLFEVQIPHLRTFMTEILHPCMVDQVNIWPRRLDNTPMPVESAYHFGIDTKVQINWGESLSAEQAAAHGIDPEFL